MRCAGSDSPAEDLVHCRGHSNSRLAKGNHMGRPRERDDRISGKKDLAGESQLLQHRFVKVNSGDDLMKSVTGDRLAAFVRRGSGGRNFISNTHFAPGTGFTFCIPTPDANVHY
jgi:hypothetical protein